eukprot:10423288-Ditylum_brightwellii.AAC.1
MKQEPCKAINCAGLVATTKEFMNTLFIPIAGFKGTIVNLEVPDNWTPTSEAMPIDMIINIADNEIIETVDKNSAKIVDHEAS